MKKDTYLKRLTLIGYTELEAKDILDGVKWSMVMINDTVKCGYKLYAIDGSMLWDEHKITWVWMPFGNPKM